MAASSSSSTSGAGDSVSADPESQWIPFIKEHYPNLLKVTHFFPPLYFSRTPQVVQTIAGQTVVVRDNPPRTFGRRREKRAASPDQVAGKTFVENSSRSPSVYVLDSDLQGDRAFQLCLSALFNIPNQVMMVISSLVFQKYLSGFTNPLCSAAIGRLPTLQDSPLPQHLKHSECDLVIIHRHYGLVVGEIKSAGSSSHFRSAVPEDQRQVILKQVEKAIRQLQNQAMALRHLLSDLPPVRITLVVMLPNITSARLRSALSASASLLQEASQALSLPQDVDQVVGRCLCKDDVENPSGWWQRLHSAGPDPCMDDHLYTRLVARFCGPATTVDIPTAGPVRKVLRSQGQAVAETGLRLSSLVLTPCQVVLLSRQPEPQYLHLQGPPGTGKTVVLFLKALLWARQGRRVVVVSGALDSRAVSRLLKEQLVRMMGPAGAASIHLHCCDFRQQGFIAGAVVSRLKQEIGPGPFSVVFDEVDSLHYRDEYIQWLTEVRAELPDVSVWATGMWRLDMHSEDDPLPPWLEVQTLQEPLRCPPTVTRVLQKSGELRNNFILPYTAPQHPVATQGPPVKQMQHRGQPGHSGDYPWQCVRCADDVYDIITHQLRVGQPGEELQHRDVFILYHHSHPQPGDVMVQELQRRGLPVRAVTSDPPSDDDVEELALAVSDVVLVTHWECVQGLERRVVVVLQEGRFEPFLFSLSRSSAALYLIR